MPESAKKSFWKDVTYWVIMLGVMLFLFELFSSIVFNYRYGGNKLAVEQVINRLFGDKPDLSLYHKVHNLVRPDSSAQVSRRIADETWMANKYSYEPWLQFKVQDFQSKYVNINGFERKSIPAEFINPDAKDTIDIYFFGGSTMYGYNVSDAETIPSQFLKLYKQKYPEGKSLRIKNLGIPYYYSKQELLLFSKLVFDGHRPDAVIFMDGLNDFYPSRMLYYDRPHFSYAMQQVFDDRMFLKSKRTIIDTSDQFYIDPPDIKPEDYYEQLLQKYINNIEQAATLATKVNTKSYFFCQPVPFFRYTAREKDPISYKINYARFDYIYPALEKYAASGARLVFLGNMLTNNTELPFVDQVHYSPAFSTRIAEQMFSHVEQELFNQ